MRTCLDQSQMQNADTAGTYTYAIPRFFHTVCTYIRTRTGHGTSWTMHLHCVAAVSITVTERHGTPVRALIGCGRVNFDGMVGGANSDAGESLAVPSSAGHAGATDTTTIQGSIASAPSRVTNGSAAVHGTCRDENLMRRGSLILASGMHGQCLSSPTRAPSLRKQPAGAFPIHRLTDSTRGALLVITHAGQWLNLRCPSSTPAEGDAPQGTSTTAYAVTDSDRRATPGQVCVRPMSHALSILMPHSILNS